MLRMCIITTLDLELKKNKKKGTYYVEGPGSSSHMEFMNIITQLFHKNNSFYLTMKTEECLDRLKTNESDSVSAFYSYYDNLQDYQVPVPLFLGKVAFLSGYDMTGKPLKPKDCGTVFANFELLEPSVHIWSLVLILSLALFISARTVIYLYHKRKVAKRWTKRCSKRYGFSNYLVPYDYLKISYVRKMITQELMLVFYGTSRNFR